MSILDWLSVITPVLVTIAAGAGKYISDKNAMATELLINGVRDDLTISINSINNAMTKNDEADRWRDKEIVRLDEEQKEIKRILNTFNNRK